MTIFFPPSWDMLQCIGWLLQRDAQWQLVDVYAIEGVYLEAWKKEEA
jgi:hypothetical protein